MVSSVVIKEILSLSVSSIKLVDGVMVTALKVEADIPPSDIARLLHMYREDRHLSLSLTSCQLSFDLDLRKIATPVSS